MSHSTPLFDSRGPTEPLKALLALTDVQHNSTLRGVRDATQTGWRQPAQHSGDIADRFADKRDEVTPLFEELGFLGEQMPRESYYDYVLVFGAYILAVRKRLALLHRLWNDEKTPLRFGHLVLLGGKRPAHAEKESLANLNKADGGLTLRADWRPLITVPPTEDEIMHTVLMQSDLPTEWTQPGKFTVVDTPLRTDRPQKPDPSAEDTIKWLLAKGPFAISGSRILGVYSQPQLRHIEVVCRRILGGYTCDVDCVGYAVTGQANVSQTLDTVAKVIYELAVDAGV